MFRKGILIITLLFTAQAVVAQNDYEPSEFRSSFQERKKSIMDGNLLRATYHNFGQGGSVNIGENPDEVMYEFPRNTGREYLLFQMVFMGAEVQNQSTEPGDPSVFQIVDVGNLRTNRSGDKNWSLNPITGYSNSGSQELARSDRGPGNTIGNTWPPFWPDKTIDGGDGWAGSWNGFFGRDQFSADVEFYYRAGDDTYDRFVGETGAAIGGRNFKFRPDDTDPTRGGLAILMDTRILAWSQTLVNATHFNIFEITNDGSYNYEKFAFGLWIADFIARNGNDVPQFDEIQATAYLTDRLRDQAPIQFDGPIGEMALKFLETPGNSLDGIDNDGDTYFYDPTNDNPANIALYNPDYKDLYTSLTTTGGGFYTRAALTDSIIPNFTVNDFQDRVISPGDKIVLIGPNQERIITTYPTGGGTVVSQGRTINLPANGITRTEKFDAVLNLQADLVDNDFDGLIDENEPNHLEKTITRNAADTIGVQVAVRYINYLYFQPGDTVRRGLIVPNRLIRERIGSDPDFAQIVADNDGRFINFYTAGPMIDEDRGDFFDNDNDWNPLIDDVGIAGDEDTPSDGQGDGMPTTGAGTNFPGEPSIDKTDVSETDIIGISRVKIFGAGVLNVDEDATNWREFMIPGPFETTPAEDSDIFITSSLFPLEVGQTQRFAMAITAAQTRSQSRTDDRRAVNNNLEQATKAYEADYQFATAPIPPITTAITGDGYVTLYWEPNSEESFDRYVQKLTGNGFDFEGYKIYKATDDAFEDATRITDANGTPQFLVPIATFDRINGIQGLHPVPVNGVQYKMGEDVGLQYSYTDRNVTNGKTYYYAVVAFDFGSVVAGIAPSESPIQLSRNPDGSLVFGPNVVEVRPAARPAGFVDPDAPAVNLVTGSPGGTVKLDIVDELAMQAGSIYHVTFEDTLIDGGNSPDTLRTKHFNLVDVSGNVPDTLLKNETRMTGESLPITDGFTLTVNNVDNLTLNRNLSQWAENPNEEKDPHIYGFNIQGVPRVNDYNVVISDQVGFGQSVEVDIIPAPGSPPTTLPAIATNFKVLSPYENNEVKFGFLDFNRVNNPRDSFAQPDTTDPGQLSAYSGTRGLVTDAIYLIEEVNGVQDVITWRIQLNVQRDPTTGETITRNPTAGDTLKIRTTKPFTSNDLFEIRVAEENVGRIDEELAREQLGKIKVVPNPYIVSSPYEPRITITNPNQQRELHFTHIPVPCKLRIFTVSGVLIAEEDIQQGDSRVHNGTYVWDMLTKDNLQLSYGVYLYHIDAPGVGETTGKFAVIK